MPDLDRRLLLHLAAGVPGARLCFDPESGRFLGKQGGWAVPNQERMYPLAILFLQPGTEYHASDDLWQMILAAGDALRNWQDDRGRYEFVKEDGSTWGQVHMPWPTAYWIATFRLLRERLDPHRRERWATGLQLIAGDTCPQLGPQASLHNIPAWQAANLVATGQLFDRQEWIDTGADYLRRIAAHQQPDGSWTEGSGPTTLYNLTYLHALGNYYRLTGDPAVLPALERGLQFHLAFSYPDGTCIETVDGRVRHHAHPSPLGVAGFAHFPAGRRLTRLILDRLPPTGDNTPSARLADACGLLDADLGEPIPQERDACLINHDGRAIVRRRQSWAACLSGYTTPAAVNASSHYARWHLDRQQHLSLWHAAKGLVIGGGNAKFQPDLATFAVRRGAAIQWVADAATLDSGDTDRLTLRYGELVASVAVTLLDDRRAAIELARLDGPADAWLAANLSFPGRLDATVRSSTLAEPLPLEAKRSISFLFGDDGWAELGGIRVEAPPRALFRWPIYPYNPYAIEAVSEAADAVASLAIELSAEAPVARILIAIG